MGSTSIVLFLLFIILSLIAGMGVSALSPWRASIRGTLVPLSFGAALSPFIFCFSGIIVLLLLPGFSHRTHLLVSILVLSLFSVALIGYVRKKGLGFHVQYGSGRPADWFIMMSWVLIILWLIGLLYNTLFIPLMQNDALEYAMVSRELYFERDLSIYPLLNSSSNVTGFYGPWTHPPLFVAGQYMSRVIFGADELTSSLRLLAPWFYISTCFLIYSSATIFNRYAGVVAVLIFISSPLLFLGVGQSLIDSLPVAGMSLVMVSLAFFRRDDLLSQVLRGVILGIALWTHSGAILLVPLLLLNICMLNGLKYYKKSMWQCGVVLLTALLVSFWPYLNNIRHFGAPISDNPQVFALGELNWAEYFLFSRGISSVPEQIQYGLFKGWSMLEAYGIAFWVSLLGLFFYFRRAATKRLFYLIGVSGVSTARYYLGSLIVFYMGYLLGILLSIVIGIDLMIKNERYLLILLPVVSIYSGYGLSQLLLQTRLKDEII